MPPTRTPKMKLPRKRRRTTAKKLVNVPSPDRPGDRRDGQKGWRSVEKDVVHCSLSSVYGGIWGKQVTKYN